MIDTFKGGVRHVVVVGPVAEDAVGDRPIDTLAQLDKEQGQLLSLLGEPIGVGVGDAFD